MEPSKNVGCLFFFFALSTKQMDVNGDRSSKSKKKKRKGEGIGSKNSLMGFLFFFLEKKKELSVTCKGK